MTFCRAAISLIVLACVAGAIFALLWIARLPLQPEYRTHVVVTSISYPGSKNFVAIHTANINFRTEGGLEGGVSIPLEQLDCKVGEAVPAIQQGVIIELAPGACRRHSFP